MQSGRFLNAGALYAALDMPFAGLVGQLAGAFAKGRPA
jgi:hypothetical protein